MPNERSPQADVHQTRRQRAIQSARAQSKVESFLISDPQDVSYLSGFSGRDSVLLLARGFACLITDGRYDEQARRECPGIDIHVRNATIPEAAAKVLKSQKLRGPLAVQAGHMTLRGLGALEKFVRPSRIKPINDVVSSLRQIKDASEIAAIREAVRIAERAFLSMLSEGPKAFVGLSERRIAAELDYRMRLAGADKSAFETIVAVGPHSSLPHYRPADTVARSGQAVLIDWGAMVGGYVSDLTRVVFLGRIPPKLAEVYEVVLRAQAAGIAAVRRGAATKTVDAAAREVIASAGYGERFVHGLGHGIGLQVHESPALGKRTDARLRSGMVVTVEPGIYLPGVGGVRIEDDVEVTASGPRRLSTLPRELDAMVL